MMDGWEDGWMKIELESLILFYLIVPLRAKCRYCHRRLKRAGIEKHEASCDKKPAQQARSQQEESKDVSIQEESKDAIVQEESKDVRMEP